MPPSRPTITAAELRERRSRGELGHALLEPVADVRTAGAAPANWTTAAKAPSSQASVVDSPVTAWGSPAEAPEEQASVTDATFAVSRGRLTAPLHTGATMTVAPRYSLVLDDGRRIPVESDGVIGRAPHVTDGDLGVALDDPGKRMSRSHLRFERDAVRRLFVIDLQSGNGTELIKGDGTRLELEPGRRYAIANGDIALIGDASVRFEAARDGES